MITSEIFKTTPEEEERIQTLFNNVIQTNSPPVQEICEKFYVPVDDGEICIYHHNPTNKIAKRPLVFVSGWGAFLESFQYLFDACNFRVEYYFVETREKKTSRVNKKTARFDMHQKAKDVQEVITFLGFSDNDDFVLMGTCWGAAVILQGLIDKTIKAPTIITVDPMHTLWFSKWILKYICPITPAWFWVMIRPIAKTIALWGMKRTTQRERTESFIDNGTVWKWKRAAEQCAKFELFGQLGEITREVFVVNGIGDKIHDQKHYPEIAQQIPKGRFIYMKTPISIREQLVGLIALEFSKVNKQTGIPPIVREFERELSH